MAGRTKQSAMPGPQTGLLHRLGTRTRRGPYTSLLVLHRRKARMPYLGRRTGARVNRQEVPPHSWLWFTGWHCHQVLVSLEQSTLVG